MDKIKRQKEHFENISKKYYEARHNANHLLIKDLIWHTVFKRKDNFKIMKMQVLEPMCGYAEGKKILEKHFHQDFVYFGFDFSEPLVNLVKQEQPDINIVLMDVTKFQSHNEFDLIILIGGLHHVPDYAQKVVNNLYACLKTGGYFINFEPTHNNNFYRYIRKKIYNKNKIFDSETERAFELNELNKMYANAGFEIIEQFFPGLISYILYYNPDAFPFLNIGSANLVKLLFNIDKLFIKNSIGKKFSFATLSILQK